jgi:hypothetical protein
VVGLSSVVGIPIQPTIVPRGRPSAAVVPGEVAEWLKALAC